MTGRVVPIDPDPHAAVQALLPWYVTGRLDTDDLARVEAHLPGCETCRAELATERLWQSLPPGAGAQVDVEEGWSAMRARLGRAGADAPEPPLPAEPPRWPRGWATAGPLLRWGWAAPTALAAGLALAIALRPTAGAFDPGAGGDAGDGAAYHALSATPAPRATAVLRFHAATTEPAMRAALARADARVADGPTTTGAWVVTLPRDGYDAALAALRADPAVALAEALDRPAAASAGPRP